MIIQIFPSRVHFLNVKVTDNLSLIKGQERKEKEVEENHFVIGQFEHRTFEFWCRISIA